MSTIQIVIASRGAVPYADTPEGRGRAWDGAAAKRRLAKWAGVDAPDAPANAWSKFARGFAWVDAEARDTQGGYKLPHHDIEGGELVLSRAGLIAAGNALQGARGGADIPEADRARVQSHLGRHYRALDMDPPWAQTERSAQRRSGPVLMARADLERQLIYLIVSRANDVDSYGMTFTAEEVERSAHRFMASRAIGINHACATDGCLHEFGAHAQGATMGACRADGCLCTQYQLLRAPVALVESFVCGADASEWHGAALAEPFKRGDHVVVLKVHSGLLWAFRDIVTGVSWEGMVEIEAVADDAGAAA